MNEPVSTTPTGAGVVGRRVAAAILDLIPLGIVGALMADRSTGNGGATFRLSGGRLLLYMVIVLAYYVVFESQMGTSPGKKIMGLKVVNEQGQAPDMTAVVVRNILRFIDGLPFLYLLGFIVVMVTPTKQRIGDLAARTWVVKA